ncbi:hypothetical protein PAMA_014125 [Pampus argenteus]
MNNEMWPFRLNIRLKDTFSTGQYELFRSAVKRHVVHGDMRQEDLCTRSVYQMFWHERARAAARGLPAITGEFSFERDNLVEGGRLGPMTNGTEYKEVRQYRSDHHLLRFYFLTRIYSPYMESILEDFRHGLKPDVIIVSSCAWDITRYGRECFQQYKENLHKFFGQIKTIVCHDCLILWTLAMPLAKKIKGGFLVSEISHLGPSVCYNIIEANLYSGRLADAYGLDVLDLHFHFRLTLQHRMPDGVHWDALAHRRISSLLLQHAADAWGVQLPPGQDFIHEICRCNQICDIVHNKSRKYIEVNGRWFEHDSQQAASELPISPTKPTEACFAYFDFNSTELCGASVEAGDRVNTGSLMFVPKKTQKRERHKIKCCVPAAGHRTRSGQYYNPLPPTNLWRGQQVHHQTIAICSQTHSRFNAVLLVVVMLLVVVLLVVVVVLLVVVLLVVVVVLLVVVLLVVLLLETSARPHRGIGSDVRGIGQTVFPYTSVSLHKVCVLSRSEAVSPEQTVL